MFHFSDSLFICSFLLVFMTSVALGNRQVPVARGEGVENSHSGDRKATSH